MPALPEDLVDLINEMRRRLDRVALAAVTQPQNTLPLPLALYPAPIAVTSTQWTPVLQGDFPLQRPRIAVGVRLLAAPGTTVEARVLRLAADGTTVPVGDPVSATGASATLEIDVPHGLTLPVRSGLYIEGRRAAGPGEATVGVLYAEGRPL
ncbi:hypothetical protein [Streptomyces sp. NPDC058953]|uniref:hypothetical protein n=1 Tax=unclassified Streptomyces TaxID=2593676 RepID=UPI0036CD77E4